MFNLNKPWEQPQATSTPSIPNPWEIRQKREAYQKKVASLKQYRLEDDESYQLTDEEALYYQNQGRNALRENREASDNYKLGASIIHDSWGQFKDQLVKGVIDEANGLMYDDPNTPMIEGIVKSSENLRGALIEMTQPGRMTLHQFTQGFTGGWGRPNFILSEKEQEALRMAKGFDNPYLPAEIAGGFIGFGKFNKLVGGVAAAARNTGYGKTINSLHRLGVFALAMGASSYNLSEWAYDDIDIDDAVEMSPIAGGLDIALLAAPRMFRAYGDLLGGILKKAGVVGGRAAESIALGGAGAATTGTLAGTLGYASSYAGSQLRYDPESGMSRWEHGHEAGKQTAASLFNWGAIPVTVAAAGLAFAGRGSILKGASDLTNPGVIGRAPDLATRRRDAMFKLGVFGITDESILKMQAITGKTDDIIRDGDRIIFGMANEIDEAFDVILKTRQKMGLKPINMDQIRLGDVVNIMSQKLKHISGEKRQYIEQIEKLYGRGHAKGIDRTVMTVAKFKDDFGKKYIKAMSVDVLLKADTLKTVKADFDRILQLPKPKRHSIDFEAKNIQAVHDRHAKIMKKFTDSLSLEEGIKTFDRNWHKSFEIDRVYNHLKDEATRRPFQHEDQIRVHVQEYFAKTLKNRKIRKGTPLHQYYSEAVEDTISMINRRAKERREIYARQPLITEASDLTLPKVHQLIRVIGRRMNSNTLAGGEAMTTQQVEAYRFAYRSLMETRDKMLRLQFGDKSGRKLARNLRIYDENIRRNSLVLQMGRLKGLRLSDETTEIMNSAFSKYRIGHMLGGPLLGEALVMIGNKHTGADRLNTEAFFKLTFSDRLRRAFRRGYSALQEPYMTPYVHYELPSAALRRPGRKGRGMWIHGYDKNFYQQPGNFMQKMGQSLNKTKATVLTVREFFTPEKKNYQLPKKSIPWSEKLRVRGKDGKEFIDAAEEVWKDKSNIDLRRGAGLVFGRKMLFGEEEYNYE